MTTNVDSTYYESFLPVYDVVPEKWEDARAFLVETLKKISNIANLREIAWLTDQEFQTGQKVFPGTVQPTEYRSALRKVINFGALPNATTKSVAHGITIDTNFSLIQAYGGSTNPVGLISVPIPNQDIKLTVDATNINITTTTDYSAYTRTFVVLTYIQEI